MAHINDGVTDWFTIEIAHISNEILKLEKDIIENNINSDDALSVQAKIFELKLRRSKLEGRLENYMATFEDITK